ncbi:MAG: hypothetical protein ACRETH_10225 [Steroidobacteraceae bacterium]
MTHTFLFVPAVWTASGTFWRADGEPLEALGRTEIAHRDNCWLLSGTLKVLGSPPVEFVHAYLIEPPGPGGGNLNWTFETETFGKLRGTYAVIGGSILSAYGCETSGYHGAEHLGQIDADSYASAGMLLLQGKVIYSWQMMLKRAAA